MTADETSEQTSVVADGEYAARRSGAGTLGLGGTLLLAFFYMAYRYPLQINSSQTSPTYIDTPIVLQVMKYVIFGLLLAVVAVMLMRRGFRWSNYLLVGACLVVIVWPAAQILWGGPISGAEIGFFITMSALLVATQATVNMNTVFQVIRAFFWIALTVDLVQVILAVTIDRMPALAYQGTYSIRFGSLWDDPNGFGIVLAMLLPFMLVGTSARVKSAAVIGTALMLVLTQSVTAAATLPASLLIGATILWWGNRGRLLAMWGAAALACAVVLVALFAGHFDQFISDKSGSIAGHAESLYVLNHVTLPQLLGLRPNAPVESGWVNLAIGTGVPFAFVYAALLVVAIAKSHRRIAASTDVRERAVFIGAFFYLIAFMIAALNLPIERVFPLNAILAVCLALPWIRNGNAMESEISDAGSH